MPSGELVVEDLSQHYGDVRALQHVSLEIPAGSFLTLLGPSGCGKTTLLRVLAGFIRPTSGRVALDGADLTGVPPNKRPMNMVFQRATLFPHLNVFDNVAFGLRLARVPKAERRARVSEALRLVRLEGYADRRSHELSGGQMQRVALARALVNRPRVLLLDEPLSALDLKIRLELEVELRRIHRESGATFVFVTHDQREALALSSQIAVFNAGVVEQVGTADDVYGNPRSPYVARFVGDANIVPAEITQNGSGPVAHVGGAPIALGPGAGAVGPQGWLVLRTELLRIVPADGGHLSGTVRDVAFRGASFTCRVDVDGLDDPIGVEVPAGAPAPRVGEVVGLHWDPATALLLPR